MFEHPTQPSSILLEIANVWAKRLMKLDDDDTNQEISNDESEHPGQSTVSSNIEEDDLDIWQQVVHLDQARSDKIKQTTSVSLPKKRSSTDTIIARAPLPNLRHPARAIAPVSLNRPKSVINISCKTDIVQVPQLPKASGDQIVPQPKAGGDRNVPKHQKPTFEVAKRFMEATIFTKTPWPIISDEKYSMVDEAWKLAIEAQDRQRALAGAPVGTPSVCQLPGGPSLKIDPQTGEAVNVYSVFCSSIGLMMILNLETYLVKTKD
jgi:hypothetical protein